MELDCEIEKAVKKVTQSQAKVVAIQLPDGLKQRAKEISDAITEKTKARVIIWGGSCFGSCDLPQGLEKLGIELLIQFGHSRWHF